MSVSPDEARSNDAYIYHMTPNENTNSIFNDGIQPTESDWRDRVYIQKANELIERVSEEVDIDIPFDRDNSVFLFLTYNVVSKMVQLQSSNTGMEHTAIVIDAEQIESDLYMADEKTVSDLMKYLETYDHGGDVDDELLVELAYKYARSIQPVTDYQEMAELDANPDEPMYEGIVEGGIQEDAILGELELAKQ